MKNAGTPAAVPPLVDCAVRQLAWEYGRSLLPERGSFRTLFDALQLAFCNLTTPHKWDTYEPPMQTTTIAKGRSPILHVSTTGNDETADGSAAKPFGTIGAAVRAATNRAATIVIHEGTYSVLKPIHLSASHSGVTIQNYRGGRVNISGGVPFRVPKSAWRPYRQRRGWEDSFGGVSCVSGQVRSQADSEGIVFLGNASSAAECAARAKAPPRSRSLQITAWTYFAESSHRRSSGSLGRQCFGRHDGAWLPVREAGAHSGVLRQSNVWVADLSAITQLDGISDFPGLRIDGRRAIRAKFPNGDPELSASYFRGESAGLGGGEYVNGWIPQAERTEWIPPHRRPDAEEIVVTSADWPDVDWPVRQAGGITPPCGIDPTCWTGQGDWGEFHLGLGGYCDDVFPPVGYWCANRPPRGQLWNKTTNRGSPNGWEQIHMSPDGMWLPKAVNYTHAEDAVVHAWRGGQRWHTWMWQVKGVQRFREGEGNAALLFEPRGGMQGGGGMTSASQWFIENLLEELDSPNEYYFDRRRRRLYYNPNATGDPSTGPSGNEEWVATHARVLFNLSGTMALPIRNLTIRGLTLRDTRYTYLDSHGLPSGGDWALQRSGAMTMEGTEHVAISDCEFTRLDGNGISINGYHRDLRIDHNDFSWIGDSAMAAWGYTGKCLNQNCSRSLPYKLGPDGRGGEYPRRTTVSRNIIREIGIWEKQSSMWFQAIGAQTRIVGNVHFNGPRAGKDLTLTQNLGTLTSSESFEAPTHRAHLPKPSPSDRDQF